MQSRKPLRKQGSSGYAQQRKRIRKGSSYELVENPSSIANHKPEEFWGGPSDQNGGGAPADNVANRRNKGSSDPLGISQSSTPAVCQGQTRSVEQTRAPFILSKEDKTREIRKKLREQEMLRKRRIVEQQRIEESRKALVEEQQQKMKQQWQTKNNMQQEKNHARRRIVDQGQADWKHNIMVKIMREDESRIRQLGESQDILQREKNDAYYSKVVKDLRGMEEGQYKNKSALLSEGPDKVYTDLWYRQEKLFKALDERSLNDIKKLLAFTPTILQVKPKQIYQNYGPHRRMQQLLNDLVANKITEQFFFQESAGLVKKMSPAHIIEHYRRQEASKSGGRRLLKVSSRPLVDRFVISWSAERMDQDQATSVAQRVVTDALLQARGVYSQLMEGSSTDVALLGIDAMDPRPEQQRATGSGVAIGRLGEERVHFSERSIVRPRPLASGQTFSDLKTVADRPATPIPDEAKARDAYGAAPASNTQKLIDEIAYQSEKQLRKSTESYDVVGGQETEIVSPTPSQAEARERLKQGVLSKLEDLRNQMKDENKYFTPIPDSTLEALPQMSAADREKFISDMSSLVSNVIGTTLKQAKGIMQQALNVTQNQVAKAMDSEVVRKGEMVAERGAEAPAVDSKADEDESAPTIAPFRPVFGSKTLGLNPEVIVSSLAAISVRHSSDDAGHGGHRHAPPTSHLKEFFKNRTSMPIIPSPDKKSMTKMKRHSLPAMLPECMDPNQMYGRHSFLTVLSPNVKMLPEYRDKTQRQVESVLQDHAVFGRIQELSPAVSDEDVLNSEDLTRANGETAAKSPRETLPPAVVASTVADDEARDSLAALPSDDHHLNATRFLPRTAASMPVQRTRPPGSEISLIPSRITQTRSLTTSHMMLRCDSNPRLSLRSSTAEINVGIHSHSSNCVDHEVLDEPEAELVKLESSALGIDAERTASASQVRTSESADGTAHRSGSADGTARASGSADDGAILHNEAAESDEETELHVQHPHSAAVAVRPEAGAGDAAGVKVPVAELAAEPAAEPTAEPAAKHEDSPADGSAVSAEVQLAGSAEAESAAPAETESAAPAEAESAAPAEAEFAAPAEVGSAVPAEAVSAVPAEAESAAPAEAEPAVPAEAESAVTAEAESAAPAEAKQTSSAGVEPAASNESRTPS